MTKYGIKAQPIEIVRDGKPPAKRWLERLRWSLARLLRLRWR